MITKDKRVFVLLCLLVLSSCTTVITSPATGIRYTGKINQEGISILAVPPFWSWAVSWYASLSSEK